MPHARDPSQRTAWHESNTASGQISTTGNLCMQLNDAGGDVVREATCNGDLAEQWENVYDPQAKRTQFRSLWADQNMGGM
jgi:hypothetical protein